MGGSGSSRWRGHIRKTETDECFRLSVSPYRPKLRKIDRDSYSYTIHAYSWILTGRSIPQIKLDIGYSGSSISAWLRYDIARMDNSTTFERYSIGPAWTQLKKNLKQWWWICPVCQHRCVHLYLPPGESLFACRRCHNLAYPSQHHANWWKEFLQSLDRPVLAYDDH